MSSFDVNSDDPGRWPRRDGLRYARKSHAHPSAHAFHTANRSGNRSLCGQHSLDLGAGVPPTPGYGKLCNRCVRVMGSWGYLASR